MTLTIEQTGQNTPDFGPEYERQSHEIAKAVVEQSLAYGPELEAMGVVRTLSVLAENHPLAVKGYEVYEKDDTVGPVRTFKQRGATAAVLAAKYRLEAQGIEIKNAFTVAASAGNHAQGVGYASKRSGFKGSVIETAYSLSEYKRERLSAMPDVALHPYHATLEDAVVTAKRAGEFYGHAFIDPFDSVDTMAGAAGVAHEMLDDFLADQAEGKIDLHRDELTLLFPAGGGGLGAACAAVFYDARQKGLIGEGVQVVLVQMKGCNAIAEQLAGRTLDKVDTSCDGTAVLKPGVLTTEVIADPDFVAGVITVPKSYVGRAMTYLGDAEPAGALSMAGAMWLASQQGTAPHDGRRHIFHTIKTGANISEQDFANFVSDAWDSMSMAERGEAVKHLPNKLFTFEDDNETPDVSHWQATALGSLSCQASSSPTQHFRAGLVTPTRRAQV